jgi:putative nucleotidyltransferase with HDIG domain
MSDPARMLIALTQGLATMGLYGESHPATRRAVEAAYRRLVDLQQDHGRLAFTFLPGEVLFDREIVTDLERWEWSARFAGAGIQRMEVTGPMSEAHFTRFLARAAAILGIVDRTADDVWQDGPDGIRFGRLRVDDLPPAPAQPVDAAPILDTSLREEGEAIRWLHQEVGAGREMPMLEAYTIVRSLSLAMHGGQAMVVPLLQLKEFDQYTTTHSINVSVLAMAMAEFLGMTAPAVRTYGLAGLLHDLGKVKIPHEILTKPGKLTDEERKVIEAHPIEGARLLLQGDDALDLPAAVAYEHHRCHDGRGYPAVHFAREPHQASRLVHVCDVYDALRTRRPYRDAWSSVDALEYIAARAGVEFDPSLAAAFDEMMRRWDSRIELHAAGAEQLATAGTPPQ